MCILLVILTKVYNKAQFKKRKILQLLSLATISTQTETLREQQMLEVFRRTCLEQSAYDGPKTIPGAVVL